VIRVVSLLAGLPVRTERAVHSIPVVVAMNYDNGLVSKLKFVLALVVAAVAIGRASAQLQTGVRSGRASDGPTGGWWIGVGAVTVGVVVWTVLTLSLPWIIVALGSTALLAGALFLVFRRRLRAPSPR
jgi:hypothetical protein